MTGSHSNGTPRKWDATDILVAIMLMFVASTIVFSVAEVLDVVVTKRVTNDYALVLVLFTGIFYLVRKYPLSKRDYGFQIGHLKRTILWGVAGGIGLSLMNFPMNRLIGVVGRNELAILNEIGANQLLLIFYLVSSTVLIPVSEEIFFRGCVYRILKNRLDAFWATAITCIAFALGHLNVSSAFYSLLLVYVYEKSSYVGSPIISHIIWNSTWYFGVYLAKP